MRKIALSLVLAAMSFGSGAKAEDANSIAIFAGGCFWCVESDFDKVPGVLETVSGYIGGNTENPTYKEVTYGDTGHYEAVRIVFDSSVVGYAELLDVFWHSVDPTDSGGQFCDRGDSYRTAVFAIDDDQTVLAQQSKQQAQDNMEKQIVTPIIPAPAFYPAEDYHQNYYQKNPARYTYYRWACGRDDRVKEVWGENAYKGLKAQS